MPAKKKARKPSFASRAKSATRRVSHAVHRTAHRASHPMKMGADHWLTKGIYAFAGYNLGGALDQTGIADAVWGMLAKRPQTAPIAQAMSNSKLTNGTWLTKTGGLAAVLHSLYKSRNSNSPKVSNELAFGIGAVLDDPSYGVTSGLPGSGGTQGYWNS